MSGKADWPYTFQELLGPLEGTREGDKLALLSGQVKIEHDLLAEIMYNGNQQFPNLDFYLEEKRRDLAVRTRESDSRVGWLVDWIEAKMTRTDSLARWRTGRPRPDEYLRLLRADAEKQRRGVKKLGQADQGTHLGSLLFAIHHDELVWRQEYRRDFEHRGRHSAKDIERFAQEYVHRQIAPAIQRDVVEDFTIQLHGNCRLHVSALRKSGGNVASRGRPKMQVGWAIDASLHFCMMGSEMQG